MSRQIFTILFLFVFMFSFVSSASLEELPQPVAQNECANLRQTCTVCSFVTLSSVDLPNGTSLIINQNMTEVTPTKFEYSFCNTSLIGNYAYNTYYNSSYPPSSISFQVNTNGESSNTQKSIFQTLVVPAIGAILALVLISFSFAVSSDGARNSLRYAGIIVAALNLFLSVQLQANEMLTILSGGLVAFGVLSLFDD